MKKFGWAYIGCGNIAKTTAKVLSKSDGHEIVAVWNRTQDKAERFAEKYGGIAYATIEEAIHAPDVDGVYIALTPDQHAKYAMLCAKHKKPVLCEKPLAVNMEQAQTMFAAAEATGTYLSEAMWTWHNATAHRVKSWLEDGKIGTVTKVKCCYAYPMLQYSRDQSLIEPSRARGALMDIGVYAIRYCVELFGYPEKIRCDGRVKAGGNLGEVIQLSYDGFVAELTIAEDQMVGEKLEIFGTEGKIIVPAFHEAKKAYLKGKVNEIFKDTATLYETEFTNVAEEIRRGLSHSEWISEEKTVQTMQIMDECRRQMGLVYPCERDWTEEKKQMRIKTISHIGFNCKDLETSIRFYCDILGCTHKFTLTYGDLADGIAEEAKQAGKKPPFYVKIMKKRMCNTKWCVYLELTEGNFIELFNLTSAKRPRIPTQKDLNYTHYALEVEDLKTVREQIIASGGSQYIDTEPKRSVDNTWQMWMHDPDGNKFELMEYTPESLQVVGNGSAQGMETIQRRDTSVAKVYTQTFGLGKELTADLTGTIEKLHQIGFDGIEPFVLFNEKQGKTPKNLWALDTLEEAKRKMDELGMTIPSVHIGVAFGWFSMPLGQITKNILMLHDSYGIENFVVSAPFGSVPLAKHWGKLAKKISDAIRPHGCTLIYHNHDDEFKKAAYKGRQAEIMETFLDNTSGDVLFEVDIGWAHFAGDEREIIHHYADRVALLHLKDFYPEYLNDRYNRHNLPDAAFAPIGEGGVRTKDVLAVRKELPNFSGAVIIDQDKYSGDMLESLKTGHRNIRAMLEA